MRRRSNLDHPDTCPNINSNITDAKQIIDTFIDDLLSEACGLLESGVRASLSTKYTEDLYSKLAPIFENVRDTNSIMRGAADDQISDLKTEIETLESEIYHLEQGK